MAKSHEGLQRKLDIVGEYAEEGGSLLMPESKMKVVEASSGRSSWRNNGEDMEEVNVLKLGREPGSKAI